MMDLKTLFGHVAYGNLALLFLAIIAEIVRYIRPSSLVESVISILMLLLIFIVLFGYQRVAKKEGKSLLSKYIYFFAPVYLILSILQHFAPYGFSLRLGMEYFLQAAIIMFAILLLISFKDRLVRTIAILQLVSVILYLIFMLSFVTTTDQLSALPLFAELFIAYCAVIGEYGLIAFDVAVYLLQYFFFRKESK